MLYLLLVSRHTAFSLIWLIYCFSDLGGGSKVKDMHACYLKIPNLHYICSDLRLYAVMIGVATTTTHTSKR